MIIVSEKNNKYLYDNRSGQILHIPKELSAKALENRYTGMVNNSKKDIIKVTNSLLEDYLYAQGNGFKQLILEITTGCNLRCKYCIYSEYYPNTRSHGSMVMELEVAKKALDFYFENYKRVFLRNPMKKPIISFYGGEPLLHLNRLKEIVNYINTKYGQYVVVYNLTTNGLMFNSEAQDFLVQNNFAILISLDGYEENHDRNRVDVRGKGTFERVLGNIKEFHERYPEHNATISTCFDYKTDLIKLSEFFDNFPLLVTNVAQVQASNGSYYTQFSREDGDRMMEGYESIKKRFFDGIKNDDIDKGSFLYRYFGSMYGDFAYHPMTMEEQPDIKPYTGTCIPGEKLYVAADGTFKICEKINSSYSIGHVDKGLDVEKICQVMNDFNSVLKNRCSKCPVSRLCKLCYKDFDSSEGFIKSMEVCDQQRIRLKKMLVDYVNLMELNPKLFEDITMDYYNLLSKAGELG